MGDKLLIPSSGVHHLSLERLQTRNLGPSNIVQAPTSRNQNISIIFNDLSRLGVFHSDVPDTYQLYSS